MENLTVCCVNWGNYCDRGAEYVNALHAQCKVFLKVPHKFVCFTDDDTGLTKGIEVEWLPNNLTGWLNKLYLFKRSVFKEGRVMFLDLDTVIVGNIDAIASYDGEFATLRDFWRSDGLGPAVMLWRAGFGSHIWERYCLANYPALARGDQEWIESVFKKDGYKPDILQDLHPGRFVSYKDQCQFEVPLEAKVVCFHGNPRPHEVTLKMPLRPLTDDIFSQKLNNKSEVMLDQVRANIKRDVKWFDGCLEHAASALLVGGGPSLADTLPKLQSRRKHGGKIFSMNGTHDWLIERGIIPDYHVMLDSRQANISFVKNPRKEVKYLISAFCHPDVFDALEGHDVTLWVSDMDGMLPIVQNIMDKPVCLVGGGATVGLKAMYLCYLAGFRKFHFYGFDSSYRGIENHAYKQTLNDGESVVEITCGGHKFMCAPWMAKQAQGWQTQVKLLTSKGCEMYVHGDGLIPFMAQQMAKAA